MLQVSDGLFPVCAYRELSGMLWSFSHRAVYGCLQVSSSNCMYSAPVRNMKLSRHRHLPENQELHKRRFYTESNQLPGLWDRLPVRILMLKYAHTVGKNFIGARVIRVKIVVILYPD